MYSSFASFIRNQEVSRYLMIWLTFLGAGIVLRYGAHIGIDTLQERVPRAAPAIRADAGAVASAATQPITSRGDARHQLSEA